MTQLNFLHQRILLNSYRFTAKHKYTREAEINRFFHKLIFWLLI
jgi:hypothetical protein